MQLVICKLKRASLSARSSPILPICALKDRGAIVKLADVLLRVSLLISMVCLFGLFKTYVLSPLLECSVKGQGCAEAHRFQVAKRFFVLLNMMNADKNALVHSFAVGTKSSWYSQRTCRSAIRKRWSKERHKGAESEMWSESAAQYLYQVTQVTFVCNSKVALEDRSRTRYK